MRTGETKELCVCTDRERKTHEHARTHTQLPIYDRHILQKNVVYGEIILVRHGFRKEIMQCAEMKKSW